MKTFSNGRSHLLAVAWSILAFAWCGMQSSISSIVKFASSRASLASLAIVLTACLKTSWPSNVRPKKLVSSSILRLFSFIFDPKFSSISAFPCAGSQPSFDACNLESPSTFSITTAPAASPNKTAVSRCFQSRK